jgi:hypothetical protein
MDDLVFTFNAVPFLTGIDKIAKGFSLLKSAASGFFEGAKKGWNTFFQKTKKGAEETQKAVQKGFGDNANNIVGALTKRLGMLAGGFFALRKVMSAIPEIGRSFKIAGDIIMRNLLWPLRKLLMPMLQKMLDWVRDHRAMFVRWGVHIANAFRIVVNIVKGMISLVRRFVQSFINRFEAIFGKVTKRMGDIVNIMMFKITVVTEFLLQLFGPVFEKLGSLFATALANAKSFFDGMIEGIGDVGPDLADMMETLERFLDVFITSDKSAKSLLSTLKQIGYFVGTTLSVTFKLFAQGIDTIVTTIEGLVQAVVMLQGVYAGLTPKQLKKQSDKFRDIWEGFANRTLERRDVISEAISPSAPPKDTSPKVEIKSNINVNVTEGNAKKAGESFADGVNDTLYKKMNQSINDSNLGVATK